MNYRVLRGKRWKGAVRALAAVTARLCKPYWEQRPYRTMRACIPRMTGAAVAYAVEIDRRLSQTRLTVQSFEPKKPRCSQRAFFASCPGRRLDCRNIHKWPNNTAGLRACSKSSVPQAATSASLVTKHCSTSTAGQSVFPKRPKVCSECKRCCRSPPPPAFRSRFHRRPHSRCNARPRCRAGMARRAEFIGNEMRKAQRILVMGAPRRLRIAFQAIGIRGIRV